MTHGHGDGRTTRLFKAAVAILAMLRARRVHSVTTSAGPGGDHQRHGSLRSDRRIAMSHDMVDVADHMPMFTPAKAKIVEVILFLIEEARNLGLTITQYDVVKTLFVADKDHLDEYGRPVTFDNYSAMKHGPVGSEAYDMLKPGYNWTQFGLASAPWRRVDRPDSKTADFLPAERASNRRKMSPSDREALLKALTMVKSRGFARISVMTHGSEAYRKAWRDDGGKAFPMDPRLISRHRDDDRIADLVYVSNQRR